MFISNTEYNRIIKRLSKLENVQTDMERHTTHQDNEIRRALKRGKLLFEYLKLVPKTVLGTRDRTILVKESEEEKKKKCVISQKQV